MYGKTNTADYDFDNLAYEADCADFKIDDIVKDQDNGQFSRTYEPEVWDAPKKEKEYGPLATLSADHGHATYKGYGTYKLENWKIRNDRRGDYAYYSDPERRYYYVSPGDSSAVDNRAVTREDIKELHRMRDREVYYNNRYRLQTETDEEFLERMEGEKQKMLQGLPNDFKWMQEELKTHRLVVNIESFVDENGNDVSDHIKAFGSPQTMENALGLNSTDLGFAIDDIVRTMTEDEREVFDLVYMKNFTRTAAAKILEVSEGTIRYRLKKVDMKIKSDPFVQRCWERTKKHSDRLITWEEQEKARKAEKANSAARNKQHKPEQE